MSIPSSSPLTFRDDYVQASPRIGYIASRWKAFALLCAFTAPDADFRQVAREEYRTANENQHIPDQSAWDVLNAFGVDEWKQAWDGCTCAEEMRLLFEANDSFRLKYTKTPRKEYISGHLRPYTLLYALTYLGDAKKTGAWTRIYKAAGAMEPILEQNRALARAEIMELSDAFWVRKAFEACQNEEQMALLFERKQ